MNFKSIYTKVRPEEDNLKDPDIRSRSLKKFGQKCDFILNTKRIYCFIMFISNVETFQYDDGAFKT